MRYIAEIGSNWKLNDNEEDNWNNILKMLDELYEIDDIDYVKFQAWNTESFININHPQYTSYFKEYELPVKWYSKLKEEVEARGMKTLYTPFDVYTVGKLYYNGIENYKIASNDLTYHPLIIAVCKVAKELFISCGNSTMEEIKETKEIIKQNYKNIFTVLHCNVKYPCSIEDGDFFRIFELRKLFKGNFLGYSSHANINDAMILTNTATAMGATVIEFHYKSEDYSGRSPDKGHSLNKKEAEYLIESNNLIEKIVTTQPKLDVNELNWGRRNPYTGKRPVFYS